MHVVAEEGDKELSETQSEDPPLLALNPREVDASGEQDNGQPFEEVDVPGYRNLLVPHGVVTNGDIGK